MQARILRSAALASLLLLTAASSALACEGPAIRLARVARTADVIAVVKVVDRTRHGSGEAGVTMDYRFRVQDRIKGDVPDRWTVTGTKPSECGSPELTVGGRYVIEFTQGRIDGFQVWTIADDGSVTAGIAHDPSPATLDELTQAYADLLATLPDTATAPVPAAVSAAAGAPAAAVPSPATTLPLVGWLLPAGLGGLLVLRRRAVR